MSTVPYMSGRKKYQRPQAMLWSDNSGTLVEDPDSTTIPKEKFYVPNGLEIGQDPGEESDPKEYDQFLILSDDNRQPLSFSTNRIEVKQRMINGRMRSYHVADKLTLSTSWEKLPSRSFDTPGYFNPVTGKPAPSSLVGTQYTTDGGAGGVELLDWYESHQGPFWVYLAYDKYSNFKKYDNSYGHLHQYNQLIQMYFTNFTYSVEKRGPDFDFWNIQVTLEEV